ncbi:MAG TPA: hypothetical protein DIW24_03045 [Bacteroidetes bacterium]|nr:hypothetical protein [Bacteroidota bacterium]HRR07766.1 hypothetical protein [Rhodothermales bacterium]
MTSLTRLLFVSAIMFLVNASSAMAQSIPNARSCNPMAQQRFSKLLDRCVVLNRDGIPLQARVSGYSPKAFVIEDNASEEDMNNPDYVNRVEVFMSINGVIQSFLFTRTDDPDTASWKNGPYLLYMVANDDDSYSYQLEKTINNRAVLIYAQ